MEDAALAQPSPQPENSFRIELRVTRGGKRIDQVLMEALREKSANHYLKHIPRSEFKELFKKKRILIKGQPARTSSTLAAGSTWVDILGYDQTTTNGL